MQVLQFDLDVPVRVASFGRVLDFDWAGNALCVWLEAEPGEEVELTFAIRPTGAASFDPAEAEYIGSAHRVVDGVPFVVHGYRRLA